jgi:hypothetical protein
MRRLIIFLFLLLLVCQIHGGLAPGTPPGTDAGGIMPLLDKNRFRWSIGDYRVARDQSLESRFDPLFFCTSFPNGIEKVSMDKKKKKLRRNSPDALFWTDEPQYHHWNTRYRRDSVRVEGGKTTPISVSPEGIWHWWSSENGPPSDSGYEKGSFKSPSRLMYQHEMRDAVAKRGLYFRTEVTAITDKDSSDGSGIGNILKGWFHLKITLERGIGAARIPIDNNKEPEYLQGDPGKEKLLDDDKNWIIDRLIVSSRGLVLGKGARGVQSYPTPLYTAGVGQFIKDFPRCMVPKVSDPKDSNAHQKRLDISPHFQKPIEEEYVKEQFLWCGAFNGKERMVNYIFL